MKNCDTISKQSIHTNTLKDMPLQLKMEAVLNVVTYTMFLRLATKVSHDRSGNQKSQNKYFFCYTFIGLW